MIGRLRKNQISRKRIEWDNLSQILEISRIMRDRNRRISTIQQYQKIILNKVSNTWTNQTKIQRIRIYLYK